MSGVGYLLFPPGGIGMERAKIINNEVWEGGRLQSIPTGWFRGEALTASKEQTKGNRVWLVRQSNPSNALGGVDCIEGHVGDVCFYSDSDLLDFLTWWYGIDKKAASDA